MIFNEIEISNPKISLINYINTPPNQTSTNMLNFADSGANMNLARQATPTMATLIMENEMKARLPDGIIMESTHIATPQLPVLSKQERKIHIFQKYRQPH